MPGDAPCLGLVQCQRVRGRVREKRFCHPQPATRNNRPHPPSHSSAEYSFPPLAVPPLPPPASPFSTSHLLLLTCSSRLATLIQPCHGHRRPSSTSTVSPTTGFPTPAPAPSTPITCSHVLTPACRRAHSSVPSQTLRLQNPTTYLHFRGGYPGSRMGRPSSLRGQQRSSSNSTRTTSAFLIFLQLVSNLFAYPLPSPVVATLSSRPVSPFSCRSSRRHFWSSASSSGLGPSPLPEPPCSG